MWASKGARTESELGQQGGTEAAKAGIAPPARHGSIYEVEGSALQPGSGGQILGYSLRDPGHLTFLSSVFGFLQKTWKPHPPCGVVLRNK